ncbi:LOW QUALITY PROTEIN: hypothetical protein PHMEG_0001121 [Phytophthora megakarya]|uniref:Uncharacterized protein n=1 Tax=Phytophthora megakarya TaxID=4795 RepID=A0A225X3K7_9STRA|nr:LOW QUALITY PROTEIN: hypothetical protein PHMEG_0001121 [Phytophthora megakarya]
MIRTLNLRSVREADAVPSTPEALVITSDSPAITPDPPVVPSEQRDAPRTDDSVREPWMPSESVITARYERTVPPNMILLYVDSRIVDDAEVASKHFKPMTNQRRDYFISRFHELRLDSLSRQNRFSSQALHECVHEGSVNASIPCTVPVGIHCSHCPPGAPRISERDLTRYTTNRVPANVKELRAKLAWTRQHPSVVLRHNTLQNAAPRSVSPPVHGGLPTPSPFPERPSSGCFGETTYLEGDPIVSNEYENEPDLGSSSDWYSLQSDPPRGGYKPRTELCFCRRLQSLHARVEALESVHAVQIAKLNQQLNLQKAYVAEAAQTT